MAICLPTAVSAPSPTRLRSPAPLPTCRASSIMASFSRWRDAPISAPRRGWKSFTLDVPQPVGVQMSLKHLALVLAVATSSGSVAMAEEMLSNKRLDLAKQLLASSDFPGQIIRAIGPQLSLDIAERYKKLGKQTEEKVVSDFLVEFGKAMKSRLDTALGAATPAVARVFSEDELAALVQM